MSHTVIKTENAPAPVGPYNQAIAAQGKMIFIAGQIPLDPKTGNMIGDSDIVAQTTQVMTNLEAILTEAGANWDHVVKTTVFLKLNVLLLFKFMSKQTMGLSPEFYSYYQSITVQEPAILKKLREETAAHPRAIMQIAPEQGQFLAFLLKLIGARNTLEIGVFTGYSSLVTALALPPEGKIIACDVSEEYTEIAQRYWQEAGVSSKIDLRIAPASITLDQLISSGYSNRFDFVFIDADKGNYHNYYEKSLELVKIGGIIAIDNVFWGGKVADLEIQDNQTSKIREFNQRLYEDERINLSVVPIADGLTLAMKKGSY